MERDNAQLISPHRDIWIRMCVRARQIQLKETEVWRLTEVMRERERERKRFKKILLVKDQ